MRNFIGGLLLGALITLVAGLTLGPEVTLSQIGSGNVGGGGRYDFRMDEHNGMTRYAIIDTEKGVATVFGEDGKKVTIDATTSDEDSTTR